ncbi:alpha/beta hydrolase [Streptomyces sp. NPDC090025]|uniref:alpha/beta hydrolase n=1 Tax=Streptomyces sp. NPDC090025 TaxID=3365922 RepID=UPI003838091C
MGRSFIRTGAAVALAGLLATGVTGCTVSADPLGTGSAGASGSAAPTASAKSDGKASAAPGGSPGLPAALTGQRPAWKRCAAPEGGEAPGSSWRCADVRVPLDYAEPAGRTIPVALIRKEAGSPDARIGSLLFNFGGPGGSGVDILPRGAAEYTALNTRYDLVSFDPRGVQRSAGVVCRDDKEQERAERTVDSTPETAAEERAFRADATDFARGCARRSGTVLPYTTTDNTARDMDLIRQVLGDDKLNYFGISYGTQLGAAYAHLFPGNVGRMVLDAVVDPTADSVGHARNQTIGFQRALDNYLKSTGQDPKDGTRRIARLLERLDRRPLAVGDRRLNDSLALTGVVMPLYSEQSWPLLTSALTKAEGGSGAELLALADWYNDRDARGHYSTQSHAQRAISCADSAERPTLAQARALLPEFRGLSPVFGAFLAWDTAGWCADWPVKGATTTMDASAPGAAAILVVGTTGDPATPYEGAERMAKALGAGVGVLVTNKGEGHGAYGSSSCATKTIDAYLLSAKVPAYGTTCG